jgi:hypothetical protein
MRGVFTVPPQFQPPTPANRRGLSDDHIRMHVVVMRGRRRRIIMMAVAIIDQAAGKQGQDQAGQSSAEKSANDRGAELHESTDRSSPARFLTGRA